MAHTGQERVERIAFEVGRLAAEQERLLELDVVSGPNSDDVANSINAATEFVSHYRPKSLVGAMFQTMLAASDIDNIVSFVPDEKRSHAFGEMVEATERRLRGAIDYLEQRSGTPLAEVGGNYCYSRQSDPFAVTDPAPVSAAGQAVVSAALPLDGAIPQQPIFASAEGILLAYTHRYIELSELLNEIEDLESEYGEDTHKPEGCASKHVLRMQSNICSSVNAVRARTVREFGLKARIVADLLSDWWGERQLDWGEAACLSLIQDIMSAAGVSRIPTPDLTADELRARARNGRWPGEPAQEPVSGATLSQKAVA